MFAFDTPENTLYMILIVSIVLLTIFLSIALIYATLVMRDVDKILEKVRDTAEKVNAFVVKPVQIASMIVDKVRPILESALEARIGGPEKKGRKR